MMMVYGSLEAYGQVVSFFEEISPLLAPQNAPFCQKMTNMYIARSKMLRLSWMIL